MPQLVPYTAQRDSFRPDDRGIEARDRGGRRIAAFYEQSASEQARAARDVASAEEDVARGVRAATGAFGDLGKQVEDYLGYREVSKGAAAGATLYAGLSDEWDKRVKGADPNDPTVAAKFREEVLEPKLQEFNEAYGNTPRGRQWAESHVASMRNNFFQKTSADMATLAGVAVDTNVRELGNQASNTARRSPDMHTVDFLLTEAPRSVQAIIDASPNLKGAAAANARIKLTERMQEGIVKAGVLGAMERSANPEAVAEAYAKKYPTLINGQELEQFAKMARYYRRMDESEARTARQMADYEARRTFHMEINKLESEMMPDDPSQPMTVPADGWKRLKTLSSTPGAALEPGRVKAMAEQMRAITERMNKPEPLARVSEPTTARLFQGIRDGTITDLRPIYDEFGKGTLRTGDMQFLQKAFTEIRTPEGQRWAQASSDLLKAVKPAIDKSNPLMGKIDQDGAMNVYRWQTDLERRKTEYIKAGKNPYDLLDPSKPDFMGKPDFLKGYQKSLAESAADAARRMGGRSLNLTGDGSTITGIETRNAPPRPVEPRKPGESAADYLKRKGIN